MDFELGMLNFEFNQLSAFPWCQSPSRGEAAPISQNGAFTPEVSDGNGLRLGERSVLPICL